MSKAANAAPGAEQAAPATPAPSPHLKRLAGMVPPGAMAIFKGKAASEDDKGKKGDGEGDAEERQQTEEGKGKAGEESGKGAVTTDEEGAIDLGALGEGEEEKETKPETEEELGKLNPEQLKKRLDDKNKENTKIRKRAQEAEANVKTLTEQLEAARAEKGNASPLSNGSPLAGLSSDALDNLEKDAAAVLSMIKAQAKDPDAPTTYKSLTDGQQYEVSAAMLDWALQTKEHVTTQRTFMVKETEARAQADKISKSLEKVPGYKDALEAIRKDENFLVNRSVLEADAALGRLAREGGYILTKKDKAAAAKNAEVPGQGRQKEAPQPKPELPSTMPQVARTSGGERPDVSAAQKRAMTTGSMQDVKGLLKAKMKSGKA